MWPQKVKVMTPKCLMLDIFETVRDFVSMGQQCGFYGQMSHCHVTLTIKVMTANVWHISPMLPETPEISVKCIYNGICLFDRWCRRTWDRWLVTKTSWNPKQSSSYPPNAWRLISQKPCEIQCWCKWTTYSKLPLQICFRHMTDDITRHKMVTV